MYIINPNIMSQCTINLLNIYNVAASLLQNRGDVSPKLRLILKDKEQDVLSIKLIESNQWLKVYQIR
jgi:hypothetical protein